MQYKSIPHTDLRISSICLGTMTWGQQNTEKEAHKQLDFALDRGINFIDTAELYPVPPEKEKQGLTEEYFGSWIRKRGKHDDLVIASKVAPAKSIRTRPLPGGKPSRLDKKSIREALEGTLRRLNLPRIDLYQVHWPERKTNFFGKRGYEPDPEDDSTPIEETLEALHELAEEGKIRAIGVSNETPWGVSEYLRLSRKNNWPRIVTIQNQYSLLNRTFEIGLAEMSVREGIGLLAYSPLSMGVLSGKYLGGSRPPGARFTRWDRNAERYNPPEAQEAIRRYVGIAEKHGLDPSAMAIAFVVSRPFTLSTIIGATNLSQLETDILAGDLKLPPEVLEEIEAVHREIPDPTV